MTCFVNTAGSVVSQVFARMLIQLMEQRASCYGMDTIFKFHKRTYLYVKSRFMGEVIAVLQLLTAGAERKVIIRQSKLWPTLL
jgi:hypothetical protein